MATVRKLIRRISLLEQVAQNQQVFNSKLSAAWSHVGRKMSMHGSSIRAMLVGLRWVQASYAENERLANELNQLEAIVPNCRHSIVGT